MPLRLIASYPLRWNGTVLVRLLPVNPWKYRATFSSVCTNPDPTAYDDYYNRSRLFIGHKSFLLTRPYPMGSNGVFGVPLPRLKRRKQRAIFSPIYTIPNPALGGDDEMRYGSCLGWL